MGIASWTASGVLSSGRGAGRLRDDRPLSRGDKWSLAMFLFASIVAPIIALVVIIWATVTAPPVTDCCTLACRTEHHLPACQT